MSTIQRDLSVISYTINVAHPSCSTYLSHLTKEMASLLLDQPLSYSSFLERRFTIHGVETISAPNDLFERPSSLDGSLARLATEFGYYQVITEKTRKIVTSMNRINALDSLVDDGFLYTQEAKLLGKLNLKEKIVLAGHRNKEMTLKSFASVAELVVFELGRVKNSILTKRSSDLGKDLDKLVECCDELVKKVDCYPLEIPKIKMKLDQYPTIIAGMLSCEIEQNQGNFSDYVSFAKTVRSGAHLLRSALCNKGLYNRQSKHILIEHIRFKNLCESLGIKPQSMEESTDPIKTIDFILNLCGLEKGRRLTELGQAT